MQTELAEANEYYSRDAHFSAADNAEEGDGVGKSQDSSSSTSSIGSSAATMQVNGGIGQEKLLRKISDTDLMVSILIGLYSIIVLTVLVGILLFSSQLGIFLYFNKYF